jgi:hypothetical protein
MENVGTFYGHLEYCTFGIFGIHILCPIGIIWGHLVFFGNFYQEKSDNPACAQKPFECIKHSGPLSTCGAGYWQSCFKRIRLKD